MGRLRAWMTRLRTGAERGAGLDTGSRPDAARVALATDTIESEREDELEPEAAQGREKDEPG
jgi:hypothetical protein